MKYYEVQATKTCKPVFSKDGFYTYDKEVNKFKTIQEAKSFLNETYGKCKKEKMYIDDKDGNSRLDGYIYCYNTGKCSYDDCPKNNQDWITVKEINATTIII